LRRRRDLIGAAAWHRGERGQRVDRARPALAGVAHLRYLLEFKSLPTVRRGALAAAVRLPGDAARGVGPLRRLSRSRASEDWLLDWRMWQAGGICASIPPCAWCTGRDRVGGLARAP
jgi:hypothetical protein